MKHAFHDLRIQRRRHDQAVNDAIGRPAIHTQVLQKGWAKGWKRRGWKKSDGSPALNPDLWAQALEQEARHTITYVWVKGHAGHPENERCDQLAVAQSKAHGGRQGT